MSAVVHSCMVFIYTCVSTKAMNSGQKENPQPGLNVLTRGLVRDFFEFLP